MDNSLVSVGIPTFNRPEGLRKTLGCITQQTYKNLEIIVSDNCSTNSETEIIVKDFINKDNRITYYRQKENIGAINNFKFVLEKATGEYFMWAADDDYFESNDIIENLIKYAPSNLLTFTNFNFFSPEKFSINFFTPIFKTCLTNLDYTYAFSGSGAGHPIYGMFNLLLLKQAGIELKFEKDLRYHLEGLLLHHIFNNGMVKYVDNAVIKYNTKSREYDSLILMRRYEDFLVYTKRVFKFYLFKSGRSFKDKIKILKLIFNCHYNHYNTLLKNKPKINKIEKIKFLFRIITI